VKVLRQNRLTFGSFAPVSFVSCCEAMLKAQRVCVAGSFVSHLRRVMARDKPPRYE